MENSPLVSVAVTTYNSSRYVLETLESIKAQTYQNLELIVSDDCSTDNTVAICKDWIQSNQSRFVRTVLLESPINTGVSGNGNRARNACNGEWIKGIAGDDLLMPHCISSNVKYVAERPEICFLFSKVKVFGESEEYNADFEKNAFEGYSIFGLKASQQYQKLLIGLNCIPAASCFSKREAYQLYGISNDERMPMLEDYPKWLRLTKMGVDLYFMDEYTVLYRIGSGVSNSGVPSARFYQSNRMCFFYYKMEDLMHIDREKCVNMIVDREMEIYLKYLAALDECKKIRNSKRYKLGKTLLSPLSSFKSIIVKVKSFR